MTKTNEQIACNNWEKIGIIKGRKQALEEVEKIIDKSDLADCDEELDVKKLLKAQIKKEMK